MFVHLYLGRVCLVMLGVNIKNSSARAVASSRPSGWRTARLITVTNEVQSRFSRDEKADNAARGLRDYF
jgi:hypothetical protein